MSLKTVIAVIASSVLAVFGFAIVLIFGAQVGGNASLYGNAPATNITKITTNVFNGVVAGSGFFTLIFLGGAAALVIGIIALVFTAFGALKSGGLGG